LSTPNQPGVFYFAEDSATEAAAAGDSPLS
jgi:hypothetical protein